MLQPVYTTVPDKTYANVAHAVRAITKACERAGVADMRYLVAVDGDRFFPVALPSEAQVQRSVALAHLGVLVVRT